MGKKLWLIFPLILIILLAAGGFLYYRYSSLKKINDYPVSVLSNDSHIKKISIKSTAAWDTLLRETDMLHVNRRTKNAEQGSETPFQTLQKIEIIFLPDPMPEWSNYKDQNEITYATSRYSITEDKTLELYIQINPDKLSEEKAEEIIHLALWGLLSNDYQSDEEYMNARNTSWVKAKGNLIKMEL